MKSIASSKIVLYPHLLHLAVLNLVLPPLRLHPIQWFVLVLLTVLVFIHYEFMSNYQ
jgi:hypothetical protein